jgi:PAS domain-containing protein
MKSTVETRNVQVPIPLKEPRAEDDSQSEPVSLRQYETLKRQLAESQQREAELLAQLAAVKSDNDASRQARRAALNLMEDAILARRAEQEAFAERQRAETAFRESEARYQTLFDSMNEGCCIVEQDAAAESAEFLVVEANAAFTGGAHDCTIGRSIGDVLSGGSADWNHTCQDVLNEDRPQKIEATLANL